jgi:nucleoside-diphosphate-sugar epimerase
MVGGLPVSGFPKSVDVVIHLAQSRVFRGFPGDAPEMFDVNVRATWELLQWAAGVGAKQFILASSGSVYEPFEGLMCETAALAPSSFLGATKFAAEVLTRAYANLFNVSVLRIFFPYGPGQHDRLIPDLTRRVRAGQAVQVTKDGEGLRLAPIFVEDVVSVIVECMSKSWVGTFNVAALGTVSIRKIAELIGEELGIAPKYERVDNRLLAITPDVTLLARHVDITRFLSFEDGLRRTLVDSR